MAKDSASMSRVNDGVDRRQFLAQAGGAGVAACLPSSASAAVDKRLINDVSQLNPVQVARLCEPTCTEDIQLALRTWSGAVSIGGGRFSMGGQIAAPGSLHVDMRQFRQVVQFEPAQKRIRVQAGMRWRDIQDVIDPHELSLQIMQSYSNFTVGGSVSVNCHGRYVSCGPLINSVAAIQLITADGEIHELSRTRQPELFRAVFGGYGGLGIVTEVELILADNVRMERVVETVPLVDYAAYFHQRIATNPEVILHNADLSPPTFDLPRAVTWRTTSKLVTEPRRLIPRDQDYDLEQNAIWAVTELPGGNHLQRKLVDSLALSKPAVVWRNFEASLDAASLEPRTRAFSTYLLQEYFIPVPHFLRFATALKKRCRLMRSRL